MIFFDKLVNYPVSSLTANHSCKIFRLLLVTVSCQCNFKPEVQLIIMVTLFVYWLTLCLLGTLECFCRLLIFFIINFFQKFFQEFHEGIKQFESRSGSGLIWFQTICKGYQQTTLVGKEFIYIHPRELYTYLSDKSVRLLSSGMTVTYVCSNNFIKRFPMLWILEKQGERK